MREPFTYYTVTVRDAAGNVQYQEETDDPDVATRLAGELLGNLQGNHRVEVTKEVF
jgi:hypothetical protein